MRAEILVPQVVRGRLAAERLYSYHVPDALTSDVRIGHLVAIPFGDRITAGIVWALDASDDLPEADSPDQAVPPLRSIDRLLLPEPLISEAHHALAEWIADYYAAPLADAARLMLPPGLLSSMREVLTPAASPLEADSAVTASLLTPDAAMMLGLLRERGRLERTQIRDALGAQRARVAIAALLATGQATLATEVAGTQREQRHERLIRLSGPPEQIAAWQNAARARLDELAAPQPSAAPLASSGSRAMRGRDEERESERVLRQLAVLDVLSRPQQPQTWRLEELQRLTRITAAALKDLQRAGLVVIDEVTVRRDPLAGRAIEHTSPLPLTAAQAKALSLITAPREPGASRVFLLHGITGSGKTEIYLQALAKTLARGERGIVLVPEIALTPQALERYAGRFPGRVALLHSGLSDAERLDEWRRIRAGEVDVVLGSRSALFAPVDRVGLIVVDEEHEGAYKQDRRPTYHARDVAIRLGALTGAAVVLGSATPSVESYWLAQSGEYALIELRERAPAGDQDTPTGLPSVTLVDLRAELREGNTSILSEPLVTALHQTLDRGEQAILFLNRRGMASMVVCRECGYVVRCTHCDISMTLHASERAVICHYCGRKASVPRVCPICHSSSIRFFGLGTERVESAVKRRFPAARVLRWDRDTAKTRQTHEELLRAFAERRADVLVGTQMIAKGLDLPAVTLVGVVSADIALFLPDFRASERTFQLLTQVAGRAGRGAQAGRALIQTFNPEHFCIQSAARHDYAGFVSAEVVARQRYGYPPFRRFMKCTFTHRDRYTAQVEATALAGRLEHLIRDLDLPQSDIVGPAPAFLERLRGAYRWQVIVRGPELRPLLHALAHEHLPHGWAIDIDPASTL
ncbi:MAG TPA: primosomal protein N' [Ktedonobacterales bacterium]|nr:primosomal protein N' [Ktedonobacterales bacterium]